jgi:hypothetical protein
MRPRLLGLLALLLLAPALPAAPKKEPFDEAIDRGLEFLQRNQDPDGAWRDGNNKSAAVTGLSLMAFLSAGHVPGEGRYGETTTKAVRWLLALQRPNGLLAPSEGQYEMYSHGICTLALAEVVGMTDGKLAEEVRRKLQKAVELILIAQRTSGDAKGGWRYRVAGSDADLSVTGWQLMALRAAKNLGCDVPPERIELGVQYVKRCHDALSGGFCYMPGTRAPSASRCGTGILALEICGKDQHRCEESLKAGAFLVQYPPRWNEAHFYYAVYYGSQGMFQLGGNYWELFRPKLHKVLLENQGNNGAWVGGDPSDSRFGPSYCTAMAVLALTVEYRYLPIYQRGEDREEKPRK